MSFAFTPRHPLRSILVATDFSRDAELGLQRALRLRFDDESLVGVIHVIEDVSPTVEAVDAARQALEDAVLVARPIRGWPTTVQPMIATGDPVIEIAVHAKLIGAELIVIGRRGLRSSGASLGSTARRVLEQAHVPVLVANGSVRAAGYARPLVAVDLDLASVDVILLAARLLPERAPVGDVIHAFEVSFEGTAWRGSQLTAWGRRFEQEAASRLDELLRSLPRTDACWRPAVEHGCAADIVVARAERGPADLVALGAHEATGLRRLLSRSVSIAVLQRVRCDVLMVPAPAVVSAFPPRPASSADAP